MSDYSAATIGAAAQLAGTAMSISAQGELYDKTREWNEKMWEKTNEYNSPSSQMARFKDAGLNPNLMYGSIANSNASNLQLNDAYGAKSIGDTLSKLDWQALALNIAKSKEELVGMRLENKIKREQADIASSNAFIRGAEMKALQSFAEGNGMRVSPDGAYVTYDDGVSVPVGMSDGVFYFRKMLADLNYLSAKTNDVETRKELNELKKLTQDLINSYKTTENKWQPWLYGIDAGAKVLNGVTGLIKPFVPGKLNRPPIKYNPNYR